VAAAVISGVPYASSDNPYLTGSLPKFPAAPAGFDQQGTNVCSLNDGSSPLIPPLTTIATGKKPLPCVVMAMPQIPWTPNMTVNVAANMFIESGSCMYLST
jgi:hypothetical protein